jgi:hypothetical protein
MKYIIEQGLSTGWMRSWAFPDTYTQAVAESILDDNPHLDYRITSVPELVKKSVKKSVKKPYRRHAAVTPLELRGAKAMLTSAMAYLGSRRSRNDFPFYYYPWIFLYDARLAVTRQLEQM